MLESPTAPTADQSLPAGEALLKLLRLQGVRAIFSSPGSEWPALWDALAAPLAPGEEPFQFYNTRHESLTVAMAIAYHKATGELPAVFIHSTVGPLHAAMAIKMAHREGIPLLIFSGDSNTWGLDPGFDPAYQWLRSLAETGGTSRALAPMVKWSEQVANIWQFGEMVQQAIRAAITPTRGPAYLGIPFEISLSRIPAHALPTTPVPQPVFVPDPRALDRFAEALLQARQPVIIAEESGRDPENVGRLVRLAEALGAAVLESQLPGWVNFPSDHPLHQGFQAAPVIQDADVILLAGVRGPWHQPSLQSPLQAKILLADEDPARLYMPVWPFHADDIASGSLAATLDGLIERVEAARPNAEVVASRSARWAERHRRQRQAWEDEAQSVANATPIDQRWLARELGAVIPEDAIVTEETITARTSLERYLRRVRPGSYVTRMTAGLGVGVAMAVGLKVAHPDRPVICIAGDGAFNYNPSVAAFGAMQEANAPVLTIIANNRSYASMKSGHEKVMPEGWAAKHDIWYGSPIAPSPEYALLAQAFGGYGEKVEQPDQIRPAFERALNAVRGGRLAVLDIIIAE